MPAFTDILSQIAGAYRERRDDVEKQNAALRDLFARVEPADADVPLTVAPLAQATLQLKRQFDAHHGGFGGAPKFPHPTSLELLLRHWARSARRQARHRGAARRALHAPEDGARRAL